MPREIKRYDNRKLYDTEVSEYVSLSDIADLVRSGETVKVVDNATGEDRTSQTLTQIILEEGKGGREILPSDLLHDLLHRSGEALDSGLSQLRMTVDELMQSSVGQLTKLVHSRRQEEVDRLRERLERLERRLSGLLEEMENRRNDTPHQKRPEEDQGSGQASRHGPAPSSN